MAKKLKNIKVEFISLVKKGANRKTVLLKTGDKEEKDCNLVLNLKVSKADEEKQIVYGTVYSPGEVDTQDDFTDAAEIEKMAHEFVSSGRVDRVDTNHSLEPVEASIVESWLVKSDKDGFLPDAPKGSWCVGIHIEKAELWKELKEGGYQGLSLYGSAEREDVKSKSDDGYASVSFGAGASNFENLISKIKSVFGTLVQKAEKHDQAEITAAAGMLEKIEKQIKDIPAGGQPPQANPERQTIDNDLKSLLQKVEGIAGRITQKRSQNVDPTLVTKEKDYAKLIQADSEVIVKSAIDAESQMIGGVLIPEVSSMMIDFIVQQEIFNEVTVQRSDKLKCNIDYFPIMRRVLRRIPQGQAPETWASTSNKGRQLDMLEVDLFARILRDAYRNNKNNPNFENTKAQEFLRSFTDDLRFLAFEGTNDNSGAAFATLNKGWYQVALDCGEAVHSVNLAQYTSNGVIDWIGVLSAMVAAMPADYKSNLIRIYMATPDHEAYIKQLASIQTGNVSYLISGDNVKFLGYKIVPNQFTTPGKPMMTPAPNLVYGINTDIERYRKDDGTLRCVDFTYTASVDYQIAVPDAVVIGYTAEED